MISGAVTAMPVATAEQFWIGLRASRLFGANQLEELERESPCADADIPARAQILVDRGLLTAYQAERILAGDGRGLVLGQYRLLDRLAAGGMGQVFKAEHILMKRLVALKVIAADRKRDGCDKQLGNGPHSSRRSTWHAASTTPCGESGEGFDPAAVERFYQEVQAAARLRHPNIVAAFDAAEADGVRFLVMEYVEGVDLGRMVPDSELLPISRACEYIRQTALGLQHAHEAGLVHRDIKPSNLLVTTQDTVKILDLGLARPRPVASPECASEAEHLTGTPDFMAPEVASDPRAADIRSDLYSLGCTFYFLLTGKLPFPGGTWTEKLLHHRLDLVLPVRRLRPEIPAEIAECVQRLMAKDPADRYQTPADLATDLQNWLTGPCLPEPTARPTATGVPPTLPVILAHDDPARTAEESARPVLSWPFAIMAAVTVGLAAALVILHKWGPPAVALPAAAVKHTVRLAEPLPSAPYLVGSSHERFSSLAAAVAAAADGDVIDVEGDGPFLLRPVAIHGRRLTIKAAEGSRPCLNLVSERSGAGRAALETDSPLAIHGLEFCCDQKDATGKGPTPFVWSTCASLELVGCRMRSPRGTALVVCRSPSQVEIRDCNVDGDALALSVEAAGNAPVKITLTANTLRLHGDKAAAISLWARETQPTAPVVLRLENNDVSAGRILAFNGLRAAIDVTASNNQFLFRDALVSYVGFPAPDAWRRQTAWRERDNRIRGVGDWVTVDGAPTGIRGYGQWRTAWESRPPIAPTLTVERPVAPETAD